MWGQVLPARKTIASIQAQAPFHTSNTIVLLGREGWENNAGLVWWQVLPALELARQARIQAQAPFIAALLAGGHPGGGALDPCDPLVRTAARRLGRLAAVRTARQQVRGNQPTIHIKCVKLRATKPLTF